MINMKLNTIAAITTRVLMRDVRARNDDKHCYVEVCSEILGSDAKNITLGEWEDDPRFVSTESVRRSRQKIQQEIPSLRSTDRIAKERKNMEKTFKEFARNVQGV